MAVNGTRTFFVALNNVRKPFDDVRVRRALNLAIGACTAVGAPRTATVERAAPLGSRAVLEVQQGLPVTVSLNP